MGCDLHYLGESVRKKNGSLAMGTLNKLIDIIDDDKPFKLERIQRTVDEYQKNKESV